MKPTQNTPLGIGMMILAVMCFSVMDVTAKGLVGHYHPLQVVWVRFLGQLLFVVLLLNRRLPVLGRTRFGKLHALRALCQVATIALFFLSLRHIGLAEATAINDVSPVLITLGAAIFLGERLGPRRILAIIAALIGALMIIRPGSDAFSPWAILPFLGAISYATNALITRRLGAEEPVWTTMIWGAVTGTLVLGLIQPTLWVQIALEHLPLFLVIGSVGSLAQLAMIRSFALTEAASVAPFIYLGIVFASLWGALFFDEWPDGWTILGALVIAVAGLYVWYRETRGRQPAPSAPMAGNKDEVHEQRSA